MANTMPNGEGRPVLTGTNKIALNGKFHHGTKKRSSTVSKIQIYVDCDEYHNIHYSRMFEVIDREQLPTTGGEWNGEKVKDIYPVRKDCEQGNNNAYDAKCFEIVTEVFDEPDEEACENSYFVAFIEEC